MVCVASLPLKQPYNGCEQSGHSPVVTLTANCYVFLDNSCC